MDNKTGDTLLFLDIDGVLCPFSSLPDHWKQIFWRNYWTKLGRFDIIKSLIDDKKRKILANMLAGIGGQVRIVISSDWRKTLPDSVLAHAIGQSEVDKTPYVQRNIINPLSWSKWYHEATHKKQLRIKQIEEFCHSYSGNIGRIIVVDDSSVVPKGHTINGISVQFTQPNSSEGLLSEHIPK